jgi:hypothetical protein
VNLGSKLKGISLSTDLTMAIMIEISFPGQQSLDCRGIGASAFLSEFGISFRKRTFSVGTDLGWMEFEGAEHA